MHVGYLGGHQAAEQRGDQEQREEHDPTERSFTASGGTLRARFAVISDGLERRNYSRGRDRVLVGCRANLGGWASRTGKLAAAKDGDGWGSGARSGGSHAECLTPFQR